MRWLVGVVLAATLGAAPPAAGLPPTPPNETNTRAALADLTVRAQGPSAGYSRKKFGGWESLGEGCDVRERVLIRDGENVEVGKYCKPQTGDWNSIYDGLAIHDPSKLDIDHVVPLKNAWRSGARSWTAKRRKRFANDLDHPQLIAVSASSNRSKGDKAPDKWKPPAQRAWCLYARWWVAVKTTWRLRVTLGERNALSTMLNSC